jgi:hypothetical protein
MLAAEDIRVAVDELADRIVAERIL